MFFGNSHSGKRTFWRLLSPLAVLLWVAALIGFAGVAYADGSGPAAPPAAGPSQHHATSSTSEVAVSSSVDPTADAQGQAAPPGKAQGQSQDKGQRANANHPRGSGDLTSPQPISNADAHTGGANGQCPGGPYCSTRDGSPSANGSGTGKATGEPCAGCVGKADNKNPQGQKPNGSDANAGYECDTNHGIGQTNPAHTGCTTAPPPACVPTEANPCVTPPECVPTEANPCVTPPECVPTETVPCVSPPECVPTETVPCATPPVVSPPMSPPTVVVSPPSAGLPAAPAAAQVLPNTGAPAHLLALGSAALACLLAGCGLLIRRRRVVDTTN